MSKKQIMSGQWVSGKNRIKCSLPLIIFEEDNNVITYCPALDLSGYGSNEEEAKKSFEVTLSEYFKYTVNKCNWQKKSNKTMDEARILTYNSPCQESNEYLI